ncbi:MAG: copper amine oxidase N-terminal domain-containing protein [Desulfitobacteriaceae bacterium]|nr:copper amine oxidase N-terminal domain-containing protein [Desulfitobacteriaceae bacterium]MDD4402683.1 copper amine oxidase N-terminal domain-containing protein [Desulfitobacteriaceae bacterium]
MFKLKGKNAILVFMSVVITVFFATYVLATDLPSDEQAVLLEDKGVKMQINDQLVQTDAALFVKEGRTLIPLRGVMEQLGAFVTWEEESQTVGVHTDSISIELLIGSDVAKVTKNINEIAVEETLKLDVPAAIVQSHTFIPIRFVAEALGFDVDWIEETETVTIKGTLPENISIEKEIGSSLEEMGKAIPEEEVKEMTLSTLMQERIKSFDQEEINEIITSLNTSPTYSGAYIMMLAGNSITITLENDEIIQLTSFGSKGYVVLSGQIDGEAVSACLICPQVGTVLLSDIGIK